MLNEKLLPNTNNMQLNEYVRHDMPK